MPNQVPISPYGLAVVACPPKPSVDIVFVHGLDGHREGTWTHPKTQNFWPKAFLQFKFQRARILTFGYNASTTTNGRGTIQVFANSLLTELRNKRRDSGNGGASQRPLIFVAHSLGGLVVKAAILLCLHKDTPAEFKALEKALHGIIFMGTPHAGADLARWGSMLSRFASIFTSVNRQIIEDLKKDSEPLQVIDTRFNQYLAGPGGTKKTYCFTEESNYGRPLHRKIVDDDSATLPACSGLGGHRSIEYDHIGMTKFVNSDDPNYGYVCEQLEIWINSIDESTTPPVEAAIISQCHPAISMVVRNLGIMEITVDISTASRGAAEGLRDPAAVRTVSMDDCGNQFCLRGDQLVVRYQGRIYGPKPLRELIELAAEAMPPQNPSRLEAMPRSQPVRGTTQPQPQLSTSRPQGFVLDLPVVQEPTQIQQTTARNPLSGQGRTVPPGLQTRAQTSQQSGYSLPLRSQTAPTATPLNPLASGLSSSPSTRQTPQAYTNVQSPSNTYGGPSQVPRNVPQALNATQLPASGPTRTSSYQVTPPGSTSSASCGQYHNSRQPQQ